MGLALFIWSIDYGERISSTTPPNYASDNKQHTRYTKQPQSQAEMHIDSRTLELKKYYEKSIKNYYSPNLLLHTRICLQSILSDAFFEGDSNCFDIQISSTLLT